MVTDIATVVSFVSFALMKLDCLRCSAPVSYLALIYYLGVIIYVILDVHLPNRRIHLRTVRRHFQI